MHRLMEKLARGMAVLGGVALSFLIILTCLSVLGRALNTFLHRQVEAIAPGAAKWFLDLGIGPITGDFELVEAGVAFAIFAFIPLCQITAGHASVDIFTNQLPRGANRFLIMITDIVFAVVLIVIAYKLYDGMLSKRRYGETTFLLQFPIWWAYAASLFAAVTAAIAGAYMAVVRVAEFLLRRDVVER
ncbi:MAG: TRAP transporter small permease, partial [Rhodobacteraceae bacterium]|nr:TRAP transporter small permease [Paracoccaceae bacterium]